MKFQKKTLHIIEKAKDILAEYHPVTVRQLYYRLVATEVIENNQKSYKNLVSILTDARKDGLIPYSYFIDRTRQPIKQSSWSDVADFLDTVKSAYKKSVNDAQDNYVEVWLEKDALAGVFEPITKSYDLTLIVGRGYQSASALYEAAERFKNEVRPIIVLYFGDFDPSGEDIYRDIQNRLLNDFGVTATFQKIALTANDITTYKLPPAPTKNTDSRQKKFVAKNGDVAVELDALPPDVLKQKVRNAIEKYLDLTVLQEQKMIEKEERVRIDEIITNIHQ